MHVYIVSGSKHMSAQGHLLLFASLAVCLTGCSAVLSLVGGTFVCFGLPTSRAPGRYVHWELSPDFLTSGNMTFYIYTAFDATEGLQASTGFITNVGSLVVVQTSGSFARKDLLADKLGAIRFSPSQGAMVSAAQKMTNGDVVNDFTVTSVVGDIVSGRIAVPYTLPKDASNVTIFLVTRDGLRLTKGNGILLDCNLLGVSATPCAMFMPPNSFMDLYTVFLRPSTATLLPLHSPRPHVPMHTFFSEGARSVPIVVVDYSGRNVSVFPLGSSPTVASHPDLLCPNATGAEGPFTISGCGGSTAFSAISFYAGTALMMRTDNKIIVKPKPKFYYSFALVVQAQSSQGNASFGYTVFQFCAEFKFDTVVGLMPPDWAVVTNGSIARKQPPLQLRCLYLNLCFVDVCAAHFALDLQQQPQVSGRATFIDILTSSTDEKFSDAALQQQPAPFGVTCGRHFFGPSQGNFTRTFVSKIYTVCVQARSTGVVSPSNPICISAKISSRPPRSAGSLALVPPRPIGIPPSATPAVLVVSPGDLIPSQVVCLDTPINIVFSGFDDDETEGSEVFLKDATVGTSSVFAPPLNGLQSKYYDALSRVSQTMLSLLVGKNNGFTRDDYGLPLPPRSRRLCVFMVDDTFSRYGRYGDWPHTGYASELNCFSLTFQGPPEFLGVFVGQPGDMEWPLLDSPAFEFNLLSQNGAVSPVLNLGLGRSIVISFMAADCNPFDVISFLVREDPGLPSANVTVFPVRCIPRKVFDSEFPGGVAVAPCSLAVASVGWTVLLDQLPPSASSGQFSVPLCFIARDSSTSCTGTSPSAAATGWYSAPACAQLHVVLPALSWIASAMEHLPPYPVISVGFDCSYRLTAVLINTAAVITDVPVNVSLTGNATQLLVGNVQVVAQLVQQQQQWHVAALFRFSAAHQGLSFTACFDATCTGLPSVQQRVCTVMVVQVCSVCTHAQSSLYAMAVHYYSSSDWQPLLQLNLECSSDRLCISQQSVLPLSSDFTFSSDRGVVIPCLRIGTVVAAQAGDTAAALATAWNTSVSLVQRLNPSRVAGAQGDWCIPKDARED